MVWLINDTYPVPLAIQAKPTSLPPRPWTLSEMDCSHNQSIYPSYIRLHPMQCASHHQSPEESILLLLKPSPQMQATSVPTTQTHKPKIQKDTRRLPTCP